MKAKLRLQKVIKEAINLDKLYSRHLDEIDIDIVITGEIAFDFMNLVECISIICLECQRIESNIRTVAVSMPLGYSSEIRHWCPSSWKNIGNIAEPASIYISFSDDLFGNEFEEYRFPITSPDENRTGIDILFRSSRSVEASVNDWEFSNDLFIVASVMMTEGKGTMEEREQWGQSE